MSKIIELIESGKKVRFRGLPYQIKEIVYPKNKNVFNRTMKPITVYYEIPVIMRESLDGYSIQHVSLHKNGGHAYERAYDLVVDVDNTCSEVNTK